MSRILYISNTANFSKFNRPFMRWFREQGWQVDYVSAGEEPILDCDNQYAISIERSPYTFRNFKAYKELKKILLNGYDIIHCHTPMGGFLGRLAAKNIRAKAKIIYTAHGFHFYKGAPLLNWLIYYPIEKYLAKYTHMLITINEEDYSIAKKKFTSCRNIHKIDGVGVDLDRFKPYNNKKQLRKDFGINETDFVILYIAEFTARKNHRLLINSLEKIREKVKTLKVIFVGTGPLLEKYENRIKAAGLSETVLFWGYRNDIEKICNIADVAVSPSKQEGLPIGIVECLASGLPVVCSRIRGHIDVIKHGINGLLFSNKDEMIEDILKIYNSKSLAEELSINAREASKQYNRELIMRKMTEIYKNAQR